MVPQDAVNTSHWSEVTGYPSRRLCACAHRSETCDGGQCAVVRLTQHGVELPCNGDGPMRRHRPVDGHAPRRRRRTCLPCCVLRSGLRLVLFLLLVLLHVTLVRRARPAGEATVVTGSTAACDTGAGGGGGVATGACPRAPFAGLLGPVAWCRWLRVLAPGLEPHLRRWRRPVSCGRTAGWRARARPAVAMVRARIALRNRWWCRRCDWRVGHAAEALPG